MRPGQQASFASDPELSRGRRFPEPASATRSEFQRDRDRVIHATAFRRLQYKTQVFVYHEGDHFRTRLTHSLEVAQIARSIARVLGLNEDLAEALALAHDLGHTPFGHAGEDALNALTGDVGGFDHNAQTLRLITRLEARYADFDGLNLTWEALEGVVKHNGPLTGDIPLAIAEYVAGHDLELATFAGPEAQAAALADDIAYNNHDIDDGLRAGLFAVEDLLDLPLVGPVFAEVRKLHPDLEPGRVAHEGVRRLIGAMIDDLLAETRARIGRWRPEMVEDVRALPEPIVAFSEDLKAADAALRRFLMARMYRAERVNRATDKARRIVADLYALYIAEPRRMPAEWADGLDAPESPRTRRRAADFIAGMTDRFAIAEHQRLFETDIWST
ncbi:MAG: deoxyguanosinetriphosphate triphosphohydrolase [Alphaproteobacteria bacterium]